MIFVINIKIFPALVSLDASFIIGYAELTTLNCCCKLEWFGSVFDIQTSLPPAPCSMLPAKSPGSIAGQQGILSSGCRL